MNLYEALNEQHVKISETANEASYGRTEKQMLVAVMDNQVRLSESLLVLGSLLQIIVEDRIEVAVMPAKGVEKH